MFKNHLDMIGRNEPVSKKAKFWQSYVRSLKGSDDIRAPEGTYRPRSSYRPFSDLSSTWPLSKSIYDDPSHAAERITVPGYRYLPIHRETYGYSPRDIYPHSYTTLDRYRPIYHVSPRRSYPSYDSNKAWQDHLDRLADIDKRYPSRYGLLLKDRPLDPLKGVEYEPENKPAFNIADGIVDRIDKEFDDLRKSAELDLNRSIRGLSPTPIKPGEWAPRETEIAFDREGKTTEKFRKLSAPENGLPIYTRGGLKRPWFNLLNPSPALPVSAVTRDPWWWDLPELKPFDPYLPWGKSPFYVRDSYLSPVKRTYLWNKHPIRPLEEELAALGL